ncbi:hypothetical protein NKH18_26955 [Streptomyces sp. M10(2022)]
MKTSADPVRDYLSAVEREGSALPADRRQELLADLAEHIEVTRAERPTPRSARSWRSWGPSHDRGNCAGRGGERAGNGAAGASAGSDVGAPARRGKVHPLVPLLMVTLSLPFLMVFPDLPGPLFGVLFRITGAVLLCTSVHWTAVQKTTGVLLSAVLPSAIFATWNLSSGGPASGTPALLGNLAMLALMVGTAAWLWRVRRA